MDILDLPVPVKDNLVELLFNNDKELRLHAVELMSAYTNNSELEHEVMKAHCHGPSPIHRANSVFKGCDRTDRKHCLSYQVAWYYIAVYDYNKHYL